MLDNASDDHKYRSCERKVRYSKQSAVNAAYHMATKKGSAFDVYECRYCKGWHIGHSMGFFSIRLER